MPECHVPGSLTFCQVGASRCRPGMSSDAAFCHLSKDEEGRKAPWSSGLGPGSRVPAIGRLEAILAA